LGANASTLSIILPVDLSLTELEERVSMNTFGSKQVGFDTLKCPECGAAIPVGEAIASRVAEEANIKFSEREAQQRQLFAKAERELAERQATLEREISQRVETALQQRAGEAEEKVRASVAVELADLKRQITEKNNQVESARETELTLRAERRALEERIKGVDVEVGRRVDAERQEIEVCVARRLEEEYRLRIAEKEKALQDARRVNEELNRKLQQGSQQTQGEVLELELETVLKNAFPTDELEAVPKGVSGADVVQKVVSRSGLACGTIVWEAKRTKAWSDSWVQKLKDNQRALKAEIAVLVSAALPRDCRLFTRISGIWITSPQCAINLALALRHQLAEVALARVAAEGKQGKLEVLYDYLTGAQFKQRVEVIVETFTEMQAELQDERRTAERRWAKREKQLHRVIGSTAGMYGDLQGVLGSSMGLIPSLGLVADESSDANAEHSVAPISSHGSRELTA
jgi:hypothetical protein